MRPSRRWFERTVAQWQARLGLSEWEVSIDWSTTAPEGAWAQVAKSHDYPTATIRFPPVDSELEQDEEAWEQTIVHELLHLALRPVSRAHDFVFATLPEGPAQTIAERAWDHGEEQVVDRLATAFVRLHHG